MTPVDRACDAEKFSFLTSVFRLVPGRPLVGQRTG